jgi:hypothetical protein
VLPLSRWSQLGILSVFGTGYLLSYLFSLFLFVGG